MVFLRDEQEEPTVDHYYLMQIAKEVLASRLKSSAIKKLKLSDFKIKFKKSKTQGTEETQDWQKSKSIWMEALKIGKKVITRTPPKKKSKNGNSGKSR